MDAFKGIVGALCLLVVESNLQAVSLPPTSSTYTTFGSGWVSSHGDQALVLGNNQSVTFQSTSLANGGRSISGSGSYGITNPQTTPYASLAGSGISEPGRLGAKLTGVAGRPVNTFNNEPVVFGELSVTSFEFIPITHPTIPVGTLIAFSVSYSISGSGASDRAGTGPYQDPTYPYSTGYLSFRFTASTRAKDTLSSNNDAVSSDSISYPSATVPSIPVSLALGQTFTMQGKVGDILVLDTSLFLRVQDRAYGKYGTLQSSDLDFSHTVNLNVDAITPGLQFVANGHNYASVPEPGTLLLGVGGAALLLGYRVKRRCANAV